MFEIGRLVMKIAGRDAKQVGVVVDVIDAKTVLIDGQTRRRKVNVAHLEPLVRMVNVKKGASSEDVAKALDKEGFKVVAKTNSHKSAVRQPRLRGSKDAKPAAKPAPKVVAKPGPKAPAAPPKAEAKPAPKAAPKKKAE